MILGWLIRCDACGSEERRDAGDSTVSNCPPGWLVGSATLQDADGREGELYGQLCPVCTGLPIRDLIVQQRQYREGAAALAAKLR